MNAPHPLLKVVGFSASGKSSLVSALRMQGYNARAASQEHSRVPDMWRRLHPPDLLIFLFLDLEHQRRRRPDVGWSRGGYATERHRLRHAHAHADLHVDTRRLSAAQVLRLVREHLARCNIAPGSPLPPNPPTGGTVHSRQRKEPPAWPGV